ncbi:PfkB family carbohydrate kinase [Escherichia coli]
MNIASLGANARLVGPTGIDDAASALSKTLDEVNVKCDFVAVPTHPTITKLRVLCRNQQLIRLILKKVSKVLIPAAALSGLIQVLSSIGALALFLLRQGVLASVQQMIQLARKAGVPASLTATIPHSSATAALRC